MSWALFLSIVVGFPLQGAEGTEGVLRQAAARSSSTPGSLVWSDEFNSNGTVDTSKWRFSNGPSPGGGELQFYTDRLVNARVEEGALRITARCEGYYAPSRRRIGARYAFTSARLVTHGLGDWGPGHRIEVRARLPTGEGAWPAIWMLPTHPEYGGWPESGEIDLVEATGCAPDRVYSEVHTWAHNSMQGTSSKVDFVCDPSSWHTYVLHWTAEALRWSVNGKQYNIFAPDTNTSTSWPFDQRFYMILSLAVGGISGGSCLEGPPSCSSAAGFGNQQVMEIDYLRVYFLD